MLGCDLGACKVKIVVDHIQGSMAEYFPKGEYVSAIEQIVNGEGVPA